MKSPPWPVSRTDQYSCFYDGPVDLEKLKSSLYMRRSVDGGYGWGPETAIARVEGRSLCSPATVTTSDGDLHIFFSIYNGTWEGCKKDFELCDILTGRIISTDGGHTSDIPHD